MDDLFALQPAVVACPYAAYEASRNNEPVMYSERLGGWVITRHDDILTVLRDVERFTNRRASGPSSVSGVAQQVLDNPNLPERTRTAAERRIALSQSRVLLFSDPPLHKRQRALVNAGFTPRRVAELDSSVEELAHQLIDDFSDPTAGVDVVPGFTTPIPMTIIATLLGVPPNLMRTFKDWSNAFTQGVGAMTQDEDAVIDMFDNVNAFYDYFTEELAKRRENPVNDLLSDLLAARLDGEAPLTLDEILQMLVQFLVAGNETTTNLLTSAVWKLATNHELQQQLRQEPPLIPNFVDEVLRLETPVQGIWRDTVEDVEIGGVVIPANSLVYLVTGSANRDAQAFADAEKLNVDDARGRHLAFGRGEHVCLGMNLAKLEANIALTVLLQRCEDIALADPDFSPVFHRSFVLHGIGSLPVTLTRLDRS